MERRVARADIGKVRPPPEQGLREAMFADELQRVVDVRLDPREALEITRDDRFAFLALDP